MIRTALLSIALLTAAGVAHAGEIRVKLTGKTEASIRAEISRAAHTACSESAPVSEYSACVAETYTNAMSDVAKIKATKKVAMLTSF